MDILLAVSSLGTHNVIDTLKSNVEHRQAEFKTLREKHAKVVEERDELRKTLLQLHQEVRHAEPAHVETCHRDRFDCLLFSTQGSSQASKR